MFILYLQESHVFNFLKMMLTCLSLLKAYSMLYSTTELSHSLVLGYVMVAKFNTFNVNPVITVSEKVWIPIIVHLGKSNGLKISKLIFQICLSYHYMLANKSQTFPSA